MKVWSKEDLLRRGRIVQALLKTALERRGQTLEKWTASALVSAAVEVREQMPHAPVKTTFGEAAGALEALGWKYDEPLWRNPFGGGYTTVEALARILQVSHRVIELG